MSGTKRLYVVRVEFEFAAMAVDEREAVRLANQASQDCLGSWSDNASARRVNFCRLPGRLASVACPPEGWDESALVYGADKDTTWDEAVAAEREIIAREAAAKAEAAAVDSLVAQIPAAAEEVAK